MEEARKSPRASKLASKHNCPKQNQNLKENFTNEHCKLGDLKNNDITYDNNSGNSTQRDFTGATSSSTVAVEVVKVLNHQWSVILKTVVGGEKKKPRIKI